MNLFIPGSRLTWRKLLVLLQNLPPESALNTAMRNDMPESEMARAGAKYDPTKGSWSTVESMLASLIDEVRIGNWLYVQAHTDKQVTRPAPIRRPGVGRKGKLMSIEDAQKIDPRLRGLSPEDAQAMLDGMTGRG